MPFQFLIQTMLSGIFCAGSCCLSLRSYFNGGCVELILKWVCQKTKREALNGGNEEVNCKEKQLIFD
jgi:hypothetical protein